MEKLLQHDVAGSNEVAREASEKGHGLGSASQQDPRSSLQDVICLDLSGI